MAISVKKYKVQSKILVGMLVPFFLRGKRFLRFLMAISLPLDKVNEDFCDWVRGTIVDAVTTSQIIVLKWSMKTKLQKYFRDSNDNFQITTYGRTSYVTAYEDNDEQSLHPEATNIYMPEDTSDASVSSEEQVVIYNREELQDEDNDITIVAPEHNSNITDEEYERKIKQCIDPYLAYDMKYQISINNTIS